MYLGFVVALAACASTDTAQSDFNSGRTDRGVVWNNPRVGTIINGFPDPDLIGNPNTRLPQPTFEAVGVTVRLDYLLWVGVDTAIDESGFTCGEMAEIWKEDTANVAATECLVVGWGFDVAEDVPGGDGELIPDELITPELYSIGIGSGTGADPGEQNNHWTSTIPGGKPSSTLLFGAGGSDWMLFKYEVPIDLDFVVLE